MVWSTEERCYDPWLDFNEDGVIDVNELRQIAEAYGSSGEQARNVTVSSHVTRYIRLGGASNISIPSEGSWLSEAISIDGYAKLTILIRASAGGGNVYWDLYARDNDGHEWFVERPPAQNNGNWVKTYDVMSQGVRVKIYNLYSNTITADVAIYLMA